MKPPLYGWSTATEVWNWDPNSEFHLFHQGSSNLPGTGLAAGAENGVKASWSLACLWSQKKRFPNHRLPLSSGFTTGKYCWVSWLPKNVHDLLLDLPWLTSRCHKNHPVSSIHSFCGDVLDSQNPFPRQTFLANAQDGIPGDLVGQ